MSSIYLILLFTTLWSPMLCLPILNIPLSLSFHKSHQMVYYINYLF